MKKKFGQNFLHNIQIIKKIISSANIKKNSNVLEVGPGNGSLTKEIIKKNPKNYTAIEIDKSLNEKLSLFFKNSKYSIIYEDALKFNEKKLLYDKTILISNLPYNISIPLLIKWIYQIEENPWYERMVLMFQKEVAERIISNENSKKFGRISVLASAFFKIKRIADVKKECFFPIPKIDSSILIFEPLKIKKINYNEIKILEIICQILFSNRRKKLKKKLLSIFTTNKIKQNNLDIYFNLRVENLNKDIFYKLVKIYSS